MSILDASAILTFLQDEPGAQVVEGALEAGARCGTASWSEVAQRVRSSSRDWDLTRALLQGYGLTLEPVTEEDAEGAARRWRAGEGLSLGDRLCLALGDRLDEQILTADRAWGTTGRIRQIR